ncbi:hypothetical protein D3C71_2185980 [compost metagenome]
MRKQGLLAFEAGLSLHKLSLCSIFGRQRNAHIGLLLGIVDPCKDCAFFNVLADFNHTFHNLPIDTE